MPWIDPQKEVTAEEKAVAAGFKSRAQVIRERGGNPQDTFEQIKLEREEEDDAGIIFSTNVNSKTTNETKGDSDASESKEGSEAGNGNAQPDESGDTDTDD